MVNTALAQDKQQITSADQLPRRTIALSGNVMDIYNDDELLKKLADQISKNLENDLATYDIQDKATLKGYYSTLMMLDIWEGRDRDALEKVKLLVALEDKEEEKTTTGLTITSYMKTRAEVGTVVDDNFRKAFAKNYAEAVQSVPAAYRSKFAEKTRATLSMMNPEATKSVLATQLQPYIDNGGGQVPEGVPLSLISTKSSFALMVPIKEEMLKVLEQHTAVAEQKAPLANIWAERDVQVKATAKAAPIKVAVWDTGIDTGLYPNKLFVNAKEVAGNAIDDDKNGYVDDVHGIAFDFKSERTTGSLLKEREPVHKIADLQRWAKGSFDMQSGISSPEALELQQKVAGLKADEVITFQEDLSWYSVYSHGTHVAGIVAEGNPFIRMMYARLSYDTGFKPECPTEERQAAVAEMYKDVIAYFKKNGVKVVNMSWRYSAGGYESILTMYGIGKDQEERKAMAQQWFAREKKAMQEAMKSAPEILFVCGSGNENNDANFMEYIPASIDLPNVLTVGAVNSLGKRTSFTTEGKSVDLYANGYEIESFVPGGDRIKFSGTSMSSPQVANAAAKIMALNPRLKPAQVAGILLETATPSEETAQIKLLHTQKALEKALQLRKDYDGNLSQVIQTAGK
ncbi:putative serine protease [Flammeovirgaceae bacterium 311]|nr:putative serine protease [Flammeovirgaceae bacterium 311]